MDSKKDLAQRLTSLDALRGFTMFWIIGGGALVHSLAQSTNGEVMDWLSLQLTHVEWNGFHFYDLIFPLFMFVSGVAIPFSIGKKLARGENKNMLLGKVAKRSGLLVLFGIIYNNKISFDFENMRYASVLGQIGIAYFIAAVIYMHTNLRGQFLWTISILLGFWAVMMLVPVPGYGAGNLTPEGNLSGYIDRLLLPGITYREHYDPQGILLMISAAALPLAGAITGNLLRSGKYTMNRKTLIMLTSGMALAGLSLLWNIWYPINKEIWSGSFNLLTIGLSLSLLSLFYFLIDARGFTGWSFFFIPIGLNSITIYMAHRVVDFKYTAEFLLAGVMELSGSFAGVVVNIGILALEWLLLWFLYKWKIFLKV